MDVARSLGAYENPQPEKTPNFDNFFFPAGRAPRGTPWGFRRTFGGPVLEKYAFDVRTNVLYVVSGRIRKIVERNGREIRTSNFHRPAEISSKRALFAGWAYFRNFESLSRPYLSSDRVRINTTGRKIVLGID